MNELVAEDLISTIGRREPSIIAEGLTYDELNFLLLNRYGIWLEIRRTIKGFQSRASYALQDMMRISEISPYYESPEYAYIHGFAFIFLYWLR